MSLAQFVHKLYIHEHNCYIESGPFFCKIVGNIKDKQIDKKKDERESPEDQKRNR